MVLDIFGYEGVNMANIGEPIIAKRSYSVFIRKVDPLDELTIEFNRFKKAVHKAEKYKHLLFVWLKHIFESLN